MSRNINDVLDFRGDLSPFLIHLTKAKNKKKAKDVLTDIILSQKLLQSGNKTSDIRFGCINSNWDETKKKNLFSSICFTETPLNEIHCLLEIDKRQIQLEPYGLVFLKKNLRAKNISPVLYLNNYGDSIDDLIYKIGDFIDNDNYPQELNRLIPLFSNIGNQITPRNEKPNKDRKANSRIYDFSWEREWRLPYCFGDFELDFNNDVFVGLCPHDEIDYFEELTKTKLGVNIPFIDPRRNAKWYAKKLIESRRKFALTISVV